MERTCHCSMATYAMVTAVFFFYFRVFPRRVINVFKAKDRLCFRFTRHCLGVFVFVAFTGNVRPMSSNFFASVNVTGLNVMVSLAQRIVFLLPLVVVFPLFVKVSKIVCTKPVTSTTTFTLTVIFTEQRLKGVHDTRVMWGDSHE